MGLERERDGGAGDLLCPFDDLFEDGLVAEMNTVEIPESKHRVGKLLGGVLDAPNNPHRAGIIAH
jgi:hypothetical protein